MSSSVNENIPSFFGAANGYTGFRSYFDELFNSNAHNRVFVIKGGPGTGKSSFMKKVADQLKKSYYVEEILCSSDKSSLDGVIIRNNESSVALLDGTAPHERDTTVPGATDELINLGTNWDEKWLCGNREKICELFDEKKRAYKAAYDMLRVAGEAHRIILTQNNKFDKKKLKDKIKSIAEIDKRGIGNRRIRLISSFGAQGPFRLDTLTERAKSVIKIGGNTASSQAFMALLHEELYGECDMIVCPDVLDGAAIEALYIEGTDTMICIDTTESTIILDEITAPSTYEEARKLREIHECAIAEAQRWFRIAADLHFRLEDIYGSVMDYKKNDSLCAATIDKIVDILER